MCLGTCKSPVGPGWEHGINAPRLPVLEDDGGLRISLRALCHVPADDRHGQGADQGRHVSLGRDRAGSQDQGAGAHFPIVMAEVAASPAVRVGEIEAAAFRFVTTKVVTTSHLGRPPQAGATAAGHLGDEINVGLGRRSTA